MASTKEIAERVDDAFAIDFLQRMIRHKSYSQSPGERTLVDWMAMQMRELGLATELVHVQDDRANAVGRWIGTGGGKSLMFNGHLDTNPVTEGWTVDPWEGKVDEEFIYGIGVSNMKAGDAAYFCAVKTLVDAGVKLRGDVLLTYVIGELQGGVGTKALVDQGYRADFFVNSEPTDLQALTMHAGSFIFVIELIGQTRHLSKREEAVDAIAAACDLIPGLNAMVFSNARSPEHEKINRVNVGVIHGALGRDLQEWRPPQVADYVRLRGSGRYAPGQSEDGCIEDIRLLLKGLEERFPGLETVVTKEKLNGRLSMPTFEVNRNSEIVRATNRAYEAVRGHEQQTGALIPPGFYGTDAGHLHHSGGMEGIVCGPGGRYNTMPDERVDLRDYLDMIRIYIHIICDICR